MCSDLPVCCSLEACSHLEIMSQTCETRTAISIKKIEKSSCHHKSNPHMSKCCTLMPPCRQCSSSRPVGSSVYKLKPDSPVFLMPVSWLRRHWNSSTVVDASKLTTYGNAFKCRKLIFLFSMVSNAFPPIWHKPHTVHVGTVSQGSLRTVLDLYEYACIKESKDFICSCTTQNAPRITGEVLMIKLRV